MDNPYAFAQLARALTTAATHEDEATRRRADARARDWERALDGLRAGQIRLGSRAPIRGLPAWVTLHVLRGGFASGRALAEGPLEPDERARRSRLGLPRSRAALFASYLTDDGLAELRGLLDTGRYEVRLPEDAALLVVAWLLDAGDRAAALDLLDTLAPLAGRLRLAPREAEPRSMPVGHVSRRTAAQVRQALAEVRPNPAVESQREALSVWIPLTDRFLELWWATRSADGAVGVVWSDTDARQARSLVAMYDAATVGHRLCAKYRDPKENLPTLVSATREHLEGRLTGGTRSRVQHAVATMVAKRGEPTGDSLRRLRAAQTAVADAPAHRDLAAVAAGRCAGLRPDEGIVSVDTVVGPVTDEESGLFAVPTGTAMPDSVTNKVRLGEAAPVERLLAAGLVPSAEVLAELVPALTSQQVGECYSDPRLGRLIAATYEAFRRRRSLLLLDLAKQVQFGELPWVRAVATYGSARPDDSLAVAREVAALAIETFPGTILPNPLIAELGTLFTTGGLEVPLTEELAADIFMGRFSDKFRAAAQIAAPALRGTLYERYYDIDYAEVLALAPEPSASVRSKRAEKVAGPTFGEICSRACPPAGGGRWFRPVAENGVVIERQQVITTHNLAVLVGPGGVVPRRPWLELSVDAARRVARLLQLARRQPRPLSTVKDAAYAWRQALFFLTMAGGTVQEVDQLVARVNQAPAGRAWPMTEVLGGLDHVVRGGRFDTHGGSPGGRRLLGWTVGPHWVLESRSADRAAG